MFGVPDHWCIIDKYNEAHSWPSGHFISCMVSIHKDPDIRFLSSRFWHIMRQCLLHISISMFPVDLLKLHHVNFWMRWVKYHPTIVLFLQLHKYMEHHFQVSFLWNSKARQKHRHLGETPWWGYLLCLFKLPISKLLSLTKSRLPVQAPALDWYPTRLGIHSWTGVFSLWSRVLPLYSHFK